MFAPQPFNYNVSGATPVQRAMESYQQSKQNKMAQQQIDIQRGGLEVQQGNLALNQQLNAQQQQAMQQKMAQAEQLKADMTEFLSKPNKTADDYVGMIVRNPQLATELKSAFELKSKDAQQQDIATGAQVYAALNAGNTDVAKGLLETKIEAAENAGDAAKAAEMTAMLKSIEFNPDAAKETAGIYLAAIQGPEQFASTFKNIAEVEKSRELLPIEIKRQNEELSQMALDAGLTKAQTNKVMAETKKFSQDARKTAVEIAGLMSGEPDAKAQFETEQKLRKEFTNVSADYRDVVTSYERLKSLGALRSSAGDLGLTVAFTKMLDPGSVAREGEVALVQSAAGTVENASMWAKRLQDGKTMLPDATREKYIQAAEEMMKVYEKSFSARKSEYGKIADDYKIKKENVLIGAMPKSDDVDDGAPELPSGFVVD